MIIYHGSNVVVEQPKIMQGERMLDFVCANRSGREAVNPYDVAIGAVADDKVYTVVQYYENGIYDKAEAIKRLKVEELFNQILFHTEKSLIYCRFLSCEQIGGAK